MHVPQVIAAIDPGLASGLALVSAGVPLLAENGVWRVPSSVAEEFATLPPGGGQLLNVQSFELDEPETGPMLRTWFGGLRNLANAGVNVVCVGESFVITVKTAKLSAAPWSLRSLGVLSDSARMYGIRELEQQTPEDATRLFPNPRLKDVGLWHRGGAGHARDALRHAAYAFTVNGWRGPGLAPAPG